MTVRYLFEIQEALSKLFQKYPVILRCIGTPSDFVMNGINIENVRWDESTEVNDLLTFDIGIMPLFDDLFSRGKCGLKLIQYMACGIPSVASPVGANKDIIQNGVNGFLASNADEWINKLALLIEDQRLREKIGKEGRMTVIKRYTFQITAPKLLEIYKENARKNS
jgi:glycosyltransferase involved in cell wall biosynthesis